AALPEREVGVLDRERRRRRCGPAGEGVIESGGLAQQEAHRPAGGDDVGGGGGGGGVAGGQAQQGEAQRGGAEQVEGAPRLVRREAGELGLAARRRQRGEVDRGQRQAADAADFLDRLAGVHREGGAQRLVAQDDRGERLVEGARPQRSGEAQ